MNSINYVFDPLQDLVIFSASAGCSCCVIHGTVMNYDKLLVVIKDPDPNDPIK